MRGRPVEALITPPLRAVVNDATVHAQWDEFVARAPGGHHAQTSLWGQVKTVSGWRPVRVLLFDGDGSLVGGCQVLTRVVRGVLRVAFASRGPLIAADRPDALDVLLEGLAHALGGRSLTYLRLQPPDGRQDLVDQLRSRGFVPSTLEGAPTTTVRLDLRRANAEMLAAMRPGTRKNLRRAERRDVRVRVGTLEDVPLFHELVKCSAARIGYRPPPLEYYERMLRLFAVGDRAALLIAEHAATPLAALLSIGYGESAVAKTIGWTGGASRLYPNELLYWRSVEWAKDRGYRWFDFEGIDRAAAGGGAGAGGDRSAPGVGGATQFKLGFGGTIAHYPGPLDYSFHPLVREILRGVSPRLGALDRLRTRRGVLGTTGPT